MENIIENSSGSIENGDSGSRAPRIPKVGQEQIHSLLFGEKLTWHEIIYDLINTEQLDPWDIDIGLLANKYLEKVRLLEEANFFISSKVLLAAALLLRMKSEILLDHELPNLDAILFGRKEEKKYTQERIELDEDVPSLVAKTPLPRFRKVTLEELMSALNKAIVTENRRIKKFVIAKQQEFETALFLPKQNINLKDKIKEVHDKLKDIFKDRETKVGFSEIAGQSDDERISTFIPLLHLDNQHKVWLEQEGHLSEIWILLKHIYEKQNAEELARMRKEVEEEIGKLSVEVDDEGKQRIQEVENEFDNPIGNALDGEMESAIEEVDIEEE